MKYIETFELTVAIKNIYTYTFCVLACCFGMVKVSANIGTYTHKHAHDLFIFIWIDQLDWLELSRWHDSVDL